MVTMSTNLMSPLLPDFRFNDQKIQNITIVEQLYPFRSMQLTCEENQEKIAVSKLNEKGHF